VCHNGCRAATVVKLQEGSVMQHSAVDLEQYARMYTQDRLRVAAQHRRANEVVTSASLLNRTLACVQAWFSPAAQEHVPGAPVAARPVQLVPMSTKAQPATADPYAGMIVLVRGPKADAA
jgi:hypothetical protein